MRAPDPDYRPEPQNGIPPAALPDSEPNAESAAPAPPRKEPVSQPVRWDDYRDVYQGPSRIIQHLPPITAQTPPRVDNRTPLRAWDLAALVVFYIVCGVLLTSLVAAGAFLLFGISFSALKESTEATAIVDIVSQALLSAATVGFLYILVRARSGAPFWRTVGWRSFRNAAPRFATVTRYVFGGFIMAILVAWASRLFDTDSPLPMEDLFRSRASVLMLMALGILVAPLVEETIFRGCIYPVIARRFGIATGVISTGTLFGLVHAPQLWGGWWQIALLIVVGIVLTYVRARAGTVAASYLVHLGYNTILFAGFYVATGGLHSLSS